MRTKQIVVAVALGVAAGVGAVAVAAAQTTSHATLNVADQQRAVQRARATLGQHGKVRIGRAFTLSGTFVAASGSKKTGYRALLYVKGENGKFAPFTGIDGKGGPHALTAVVRRGAFGITVPASFVRHTPGTETFMAAIEVPHGTKAVAWTNQLVVTFVR